METQCLSAHSLHATVHTNLSLSAPNISLPVIVVADASGRAV
jgi:hypothetical protein